MRNITYLSIAIAVATLAADFGQRWVEGKLSPAEMSLVGNAKRSLSLATAGFSFPRHCEGLVLKSPIPH